MMDIEDEVIYVVVRNHEGQYAIWRGDREIPAGWEVQGEPARKDICLAYIRTHWTDMTPLSVRNAASSRSAR